MNPLKPIAHGPRHAYQRWRSPVVFRPPLAVFGASIHLDAAFPIWIPANCFAIILGQESSVVQKCPVVVLPVDLSVYRSPSSVLKPKMDFKLPLPLQANRRRARE